MKVGFLLNVFILSSLVPVHTRPASAQNVMSGDTCRLDWSGVPGRAEPTRYGGPNTTGKPVIFGNEYRVPELYLRLVDARTGKPVIPKAVNVHYYWLWFEWPYPEHEGGVWSNAEDLVTCSTGGDNLLVVPSHTVKPRGWYEGKFTRFPYTLLGSRKPKFERIDLVIEKDSCAPRLSVNQREIGRYKDTTAIVKLPCAGDAFVQFERGSR